MAKIKCVICKKFFEVPEYRLKRNPKYCSHKCRAEGRSKNSQERRKCPVCKKFFETYKKSTKKYCSNNCASKAVGKVRAKNARKTIEKKYGKDYFLTDDFKKKSRQTKRKRYGDEKYVNVSKAKKTKREKYGNKNFNNIEKNKQTKKEKYGDENYNNRKKFTKTMKEKYNGIGLQRNEVMQSAKEGMLKKYGVNYALESTEIRNKIKATNLKKYGKETYWGSTTQRNLILNKRIEKLEPILKKRKIQLISEYKGNRKINKDGKIHHIKYNFKCLECNNDFKHSIANGLIPSCPYCNPKSQYVSKYETEIYEYLREIMNKNESILLNNRNLLSYQGEIDIYIPSKEVAIEFNGLFWHSESNGKDKEYHLKKTIECEAQNIQLIHIFEDEWLLKKELVKNKLSHILNINPNGTIYARNCKIKEIESTNKNEFLNKYHIQGEDKSLVKIGAFYDDELVAVMTFGQKRISLGSQSRRDEYELIRFATSQRIVGIASKLLKHFIKEYNPEKIISYADRRWTFSKNNLYEKIGFKKLSNGTPNYWYIESNYTNRIHRFNFRKSVLNEKLNDFDSNLTEWENMQLNGYDRIWDCGHLKYELEI